jgi:hypothetical protein
VCLCGACLARYLETELRSTCPVCYKQGVVFHLFDSVDQSYGGASSRRYIEDEKGMYASDKEEQEEEEEEEEEEGMQNVEDENLYYSNNE